MIKKMVCNVMIIFTLLLAACGSFNAAKNIESICGVELPEELEIEYNYYEQFPQGDFTQYTVFKLKQEPAEFLNDNSFSEGTRNAFYELLSIAMVPQEYRPDFGIEYFVAEITPKKEIYKGVYVLAFYFPNETGLIFFMSQS